MQRIDSGSLRYTLMLQRPAPPILKNEREMAVWLRMQHLDRVLARDCARGKRRPRLEQERRILGNLAAGLAAPILTPGGSLRTFERDAHPTMVRKSIRWLRKIHREQEKALIKRLRNGRRGKRGRPS